MTYLLCSREKNSALVLDLLRKVPLRAEVTITLPGFSIPRIIIHRCAA